MRMSLKTMIYKRVGENVPAFSRVIYFKNSMPGFGRLVPVTQVSPGGIFF